MTDPAERDPELLDKVVNLTKRRGFIFPSAEKTRQGSPARVRTVPGATA